MMTSPLAPHERQYAAWLGGVERRVILPLKWLFLFFTAVYWIWSHGGLLPSNMAFGLFAFFAGITGAEQYFISRDRVTPRQMRPFIFGSYMTDAIFVTLLILADNLETVYNQDVFHNSEFFLFYVLLVLRGFALFRNQSEHFFAFAVVTVLFLLAAVLQLHGAHLLGYLPTVQNLALVWVLMLLIQVFMLLVNSLKEEQIRSAHDIERRASLASLGELSAGVAHEINNPIGIIRSYAEFLEKSVSPGDPLREDFQTIRSEAERCEMIVRQMLDFSNPNVSDLESLDIQQIVKETVSLVFHESQEGQFRAGVKSSESVLPSVKGDQVQIKQAFLNILLNARQVMKEHEDSGKDIDFQGTVEVRFSRGKGPRPPVRIEIQDNGPGISQEDASKAFEPFYTKKKKGTGLGLAVTRRIIEAHNGTISIAGAEDGGTIVTVELPIEGEEQA
jgi:signal transduction histidine kinase